MSVRTHATDPLIEAEHAGPLAGLQTPLREAEHAALQQGGVGVARRGEVQVAAVVLGQLETGGPPHGVISVGREGRSFSDDGLELLRSLAARATLALANVNLHRDVAHQAVTDDHRPHHPPSFPGAARRRAAGAVRYAYPVASRCSTSTTSNR